MGSNPEEIKWDSVGESHRRDLWESLNKTERALAWKYAQPEEKRAIADITSIDLNKLENRAKKLPTQSRLVADAAERDPKNEADLAEFELRRIHRERVESELEALRKGFSDYSEANKIRSRKRRSENVYILVAIGIIGGYLSYNPNIFLNNIYQMIGLLFTIASGIFIMTKVITVRISKMNQGTFWIRVDNIIDIAFAAVITGVFVFGSLGVAASIFNIQPESSGALLSVPVTVLAMIAQLSLIWRRYTENTRQPEEVHGELIESLFRLPDSSNKDEKSDEILDLVGEYAQSGAISSQIEDIQDKVEKIDGIPDNIRTEITTAIDSIIEEKEKEEKSEEELRTERIAELEKQREQYRNVIRKEE